MARHLSFVTTQNHKGRLELDLLQTKENHKDREAKGRRMQQGDVLVLPVDWWHVNLAN